MADGAVADVAVADVSLAGMDAARGERRQGKEEIIQVCWHQQQETQQGRRTQTHILNRGQRRLDAGRG